MPPATTGRVEAIWIKRAKQGPMDSVEATQAIAGRGLENNANQGGRRQVTLLSQEAWQAVRDHLDQPELDPRLRRANLYLSGIDLIETRDRILAVGSVQILIHGETRPCRAMEEAQEGLQDALSTRWHGGAYGEILQDGKISAGDPIDWIKHQRTQ